ncbi:MAG: nickel-dependent lactate racemase [Candidatus Latescibacteria bacterium]|nr:nickel-dependent lactate racemase [Candidatus Latescibacterota bacterium]
MIQQIDVAYGRGHVPIQADFDMAEWQVIRPQFEAALEDPKQGFVDAVRNPIGAKPLRELVKPGDRVVIATSDGTRPVPNKQLISWLLDELPVPEDQVTVLIGTGTHRPNTDEELADMFGEDVMKRVKIVNHDAFDELGNEQVGKTESGTPVVLDKIYLQADFKIAVGFIEPHFFAGFSGGPKAVAPGVASIDTIFRLHRAELIGDPKSTWGVLDENPLHTEIREAVALSPPDFMVNVTLNAEKQISNYYVGDYREAHIKGCADVKVSAMVAVKQPFPVVVTSNSGFPLDQNLYQTVKGLSAAARIVTEGGKIFVASECSDGVPNHGNFASLMLEGQTPTDVIQSVYNQEPVLDQWQAQVLSNILERADVGVFTAMDAEAVRNCKMTVVEDLDEAVQAHVKALGGDARVAVLPDGPLTIPYVEGQ